MNLKYLCIGHCCHDQVGVENILGGTVSYAALLAKTWGESPIVVTSVGKDFQFFDQLNLQNIPIHFQWATRTTIFKNEYENGKRKQYLLARATRFM